MKSDRMCCHLFEDLQNNMPVPGWKTEKLWFDSRQERTFFFQSIQAGPSSRLIYGRVKVLAPGVKGHGREADH
jgi:hypothetical protein